MQTFVFFQELIFVPAGLRQSSYLKFGAMIINLLAIQFS